MAAACGIQFVVGAELSVTVAGKEVHLLGYGFDPEDAGMQEHLRRFMAARAERAQRMVERLQQEGIALTMDDVRAEAEDAHALGRPHVAAALVGSGTVDSLQAAFDRFLSPGQPAYVAKPETPVADVLTRLHRAGGVGVLAHPGQWTPTERLHRLLDAGLDGIEVAHPSHPPYLRTYYRQFAVRNDLLQTGGSDYHGPRHDDHFGSVGLSQRQWERLQEAVS